MNQSFIRPNDQETWDDLLAIDRFTKDELRQRFKTWLDHDWEANTIATCFTEFLCRTLYMHITTSDKTEVTNVIERDTTGEISFNFMDLFTIKVSEKRNDDAEKAGNINIFFIMGKEAENIIANDIPREERKIEPISIEAFVVEKLNEKTMEVYKTIDKMARKELLDKYGISIGVPYVAFITAFIFFRNFFEELINKLVTEDKRSTSINFSDIIEFYAERNANDEVVISARPGMAAKLIIKSDETTEADDFEDEFEVL